MLFDAGMRLFSIDITNIRFKRHLDDEGKSTGFSPYAAPNAEAFERNSP